jgi:CheY-like chemotaxis protein
MKIQSDGAIPDIVLIEDDPMDVELIVRALRCAGFADKIEILRDGQEALDHFFLNGTTRKDFVLRAPKLVMLDLKLPKVGGVEVLRRLKSDPRTQGICIVAFTSSREEVDLSECYRLGVNSFVQKPIDYDALENAVATLSEYWVRINERPLHSEIGA